MEKVQQQDGRTSKVRVGMISYDHVHAEFRSRALAEMPNDVRLVAIAEVDEVRGHEAIQRFGGSYYKDYRELLARDDIDLVFIHSANHTHKEIVLDTVAAGKHLFCEKPLANTVAEAEEMVEAVRRHGLRHAVGFCSRFIPEAECAKEMIGAGVLGKLLSAKALIGLAGIKEIGCPDYMADWMTDPVRGGGGALIDEGAHAFDLLHWLVGDIKSVCSATANLNKPDLQVEDNAATLIEFENGALGSLSTLWSLNIDIGMRNVLEFYGTDGTLFLELTSKNPKISLYTGGTPETARGGWFDPYLKPAQTEPHDYLSWPTHSRHYKREVTHLIDSFKKGKPFRSTFDDGLKVVRVTEAAYRSAKERRFIDL
jgi:predicted dehydrogenase